MVNLEDLTSGDAVRIVIRSGKTVLNGEVFDRANFISVGPKGVTFSCLDGVGRVRRITRATTRVERIEKL